MRWAKHKGIVEFMKECEEQFTRKLASNLKREFTLCSNAGRLFQRRGSIWKGDSSSMRQSTQRVKGIPVTSNPIGMTRPRKLTAQISRSNGQMTTLNDYCKLQSSVELHVRHMEAFGCFINQVFGYPRPAAQHSFFSVNNFFLSTVLAIPIEFRHPGQDSRCSIL